MIERREGHFKGHDGLELFFQTWTAPERRARATLVVSHGLAEHSECYAKTAEDLVALGWNVIAWDERGHGRSEGKRGFVGDFRHFSLDLGSLLSHLRSSDRLPDPFVLFGHSMGGLISLRHLIEEDPSSPKPRALVLSSPLLGVSVPVPPLKDLAARALHRFAPTVTLYNELKYEHLVRDPNLWKNYESDPFRHDKISPSLYLGMLESIELVKAQAGKIKIPTLIQAAGDERIVSLPGSRELFPLLGSENKRMIVYEESFHEVYNDLDRDKVIKDLDSFLREVT